MRPRTTKHTIDVSKYMELWAPHIHTLIGRTHTTNSHTHIYTIVLTHFSIAQVWIKQNERSTHNYAWPLSLSLLFIQEKHSFHSKRFTQPLEKCSFDLIKLCWFVFIIPKRRCVCVCVCFECIRFFFTMITRCALVSFALFHSLACFQLVFFCKISEFLFLSFSKFISILFHHSHIT